MSLGWSVLTSEWQLCIFKQFFLTSFLKHNEKLFLMLWVTFSSVAHWGNGIYCQIKQFWHSCAASNRLKTSRCHISFTAAIPVLTSAPSFRAAYIHLKSLVITHKVCASCKKCVGDTRPCLLTVKSLKTRFREPLRRAMRAALGWFTIAFGARCAGVLPAAGGVL